MPKVEILVGLLSWLQNEKMKKAFQNILQMSVVDFYLVIRIDGLINNNMSYNVSGLCIQLVVSST